MDITERALEWLRREVQVASRVPPFGGMLSDIVLVGTVAMYFAGLKDKPNDIDAFVTDELFEQFRQQRQWREVNIPGFPTRLEAVYTYNDEAQVVMVMREWAHEGVYGGDQRTEAFQNSEAVNGWRVITLNYLLNWKLHVHRAKDGTDAARLAVHLGRDLGGVVFGGEGDY